MCADIHDGREQTLPSKGRIQMSQTNYLQIVKSGLQRTAGPYTCAIRDQTHRSMICANEKTANAAVSPKSKWVC